VHTQTELAREQAHVDRAYGRLDVLRDQARRLPADVIDQGSGTPQSRLDRDVLVRTSLRRLAQLELGGEPLVFGRLDHADRASHHIGRVGVADEHLNPLVVDWRAPAAAPFYRATAAEPLGLVRRRHFRSRGRRVIRLDDEVFGPDGKATDGLVLVGEAALLQALRRERTPRMRDIVATIQREQDEVIRAPLTGALVIEGGPGTGKTAVALHRAAYLLYTHRDRLEHAGVLLVGPTQRFMRYIADVLPALGEDAVRLARLQDLAPPVRVSAVEPAEVARLKGDARMVEVLAAVVRRQDLERVDPADQPYLPAALLRQLFASPRRLAAAGLQLLARPTTAGWTEADLPLLDELAALLARRVRRQPRPVTDAGERDRIERAVAQLGPIDAGMRTAIRARLRADREDDLRAPRAEFAHVLVDEAQDLSPMAWRMLTRRCPSGSMTIVGDLAQTTAPDALGSWEAVAALLPGRRVTVRELSINYRNPREVAALADRVLTAMEGGLRAPRPVRASGVSPVLREVARTALPSEVASAVAGSIGLVVVLAPARLAREAATWTSAEVLTVPETKGLEFDAVVLVEPAEILRDHGLRGLYIAMTRTTQRLVILSTEPLPAEIKPGPTGTSRRRGSARTAHRPAPARRT
jgi:DNA helicase IV